MIDDIPAYNLSDEDVDELIVENEALKKEIERLRAALQCVLDTAEDSYNRNATTLLWVRRAADIARDALQEASDDRGA